MATTKSRSELKKYFVKNAIPTEGNFSELIDAGLNQKDDGLTKAAGGPLSVESATTTKAAIQLYDAFTDATPAWTLSVQDTSVTPAVKGFALSDGATPSRIRLFVNAATGTLNANGGITIPSGQNLSVGGTILSYGLITAGAGISIPVGQILGVGGTLLAYSDVNVFGILTAGGKINANAGLTVASGQTVTFGSLINANAGLVVASGQPVIFGSLINANAGLTAGGLITASAGLTVDPTKILNAGVVNASGMINANAGITVPANQNLLVNGSVTVNGGITANACTINGGFSAGFITAIGGMAANDTIFANSGIIIPSGKTLNVGGTVTSTGLILANGGATIPTGQNLAVSGTLTTYGALNANAGLTAGGMINANGGIIVPSNQSITVNCIAAPPTQSSVFYSPMVTNALATTSAGLTVQKGGLNVLSGQTVTFGSRIDANAGLTATGIITASGGIQPLDGQNLYLYGPVVANGGITVPVNQTLTVNGTLTIPGTFNTNAGLTAGGMINANAGISVKTGLQLYETAADPKAAWTVGFQDNLTPMSRGFSLTDGNGLLRLFIASTVNSLPANNGVTIPLGQYLVVGGKITAGGLVTANAGLNIPAGNLSVTAVSGVGGQITADGLITANGGIIVPAGKTLAVNGTLTTVQEDWKSIDLTTGKWQAAGGDLNPPGFFKDSCGIVHLRGGLRTNAVIFTPISSLDGGWLIFKLPIGYWPQYRESFASYATDRIDIQASSGSVIVMTGNTGYASLDGISFRAFK